MVFTPIEKLENVGMISDFNYFTHGACGKIYRKEGLVLKVPFDLHSGKLLKDKDSQLRLYNEFKIQDLAIDLGISFPEVYGMKSVLDKDGFFYPAILMKYLDGITINNLEGDLLKEAEKQREFEIKKASEVGFFVRDDHYLNSIWVPNEEKTYLLDAGLWIFRG
jgi:hypothetical protein